MIDCDVHIEIGDREGFLAHVDAGQRDWFRAQGPLLGTAPYLWTHPGSGTATSSRWGPPGELRLHRRGRQCARCSTGRARTSRS